jgi:hypothetical protein
MRTCWRHLYCWGRRKNHPPISPRRRWHLSYGYTRWKLHSCKSVSGQDVLGSRYLHFLGSMVVLCRSRDSDSAGHKVSRSNRGMGRGNVRGLGRLNRVRHSRDGRHSRSGRHCSSGRYGRSGRHCRDPETRVSSEHMDLLWEHLRCDSLGRCGDADNSRSLPHSRWMMARWMMARGGRRVVLVPFGAWMTMLACIIVPTCENALRSKGH